MLVFLSGSIESHYKNNELHKSISWRNYLTKELARLNIETFNPCANLDHIMAYTNSSLVKQNIYYLQNSDLVVVNMHNILNSPGTIFELTCCYLNHKATIGFGDHKGITSPHILSAIDEFVDDEDAVIKYIENLYSLRVK